MVGKGMERIMKKIRKPPKLRGNVLNGLLLVFVAALLILAIFLVRIKLLQNAQSLQPAYLRPPHAVKLKDRM